MKIRNGFVSNSSSSSFVVLGFKVSQSERGLINLTEAEIAPDNEDFLWDIRDELDREGFYIITETVENNNAILGIRIATQSDSYLDETETAIEDFEALVERLKVAQEKIGIEAEIKLYTGTELC